MQAVNVEPRQRPKYLVRRTVTAAALVVGIGYLSSCANLQTVGRTTPIDDGTAIHLDAQQRLVVASANGYCAEPSPDALSAYVASLGFSAPGSQTPEGASFLEALKSTTGSIGLRTQSITLMRDALYRMCEASNNGHLSDLEVAAFLRRSQDLTAVVLAIEQLTGAVAANQLALTPGSTATRAEELVSNQQALNEAELILRTHREAVASAKQRLSELSRARDGAAATREALLEESGPELVGLEATPEATNGKDGAAQADQALQEANEKVVQAKKDLEYQKYRLRDAEGVVDRLRAIRDDLLSDPASNISVEGTFVRRESAARLTAEQTKFIAEAITKMVETVVHNNDVLDLCMSYLLSEKSANQSLGYDESPEADTPDSSAETTQDEQVDNNLPIICRSIIRSHLRAVREELRKS